MGFVQGGIPLGVTFSFLITSPLVNEVAIAMFIGMFGWKVAMLYLGLGLSVAIVAGWVIGRLKMEAHLEDWVREMPRITATVDGTTVTLGERVNAGDLIGTIGNNGNASGTHQHFEERVGDALTPTNPSGLWTGSRPGVPAKPPAWACRNFGC